jgi:hypothetical protein
LLDDDINLDTILVPEVTEAHCFIPGAGLLSQFLEKESLEHLSEEGAIRCQVLGVDAARRGYSEPCDIG